jgi:pilus assembly protein Flp/PilA
MTKRSLSLDEGRRLVVRPCKHGKATSHQKSERTIMKNFATFVKQFLVSEDGPTAVEYAVMLALIIVVCLGAIQAVGTNANNKFNQVQNALT